MTMVSVITVVRNGASTIEKTILSVINQDYKDFEYLIIDGLSTDGTLDIINKYTDKIKTVISEPDKGIYDAMNKGITVSNGDWIYFLGSDDLLYENSTLSQVFSNDHPGVDVLYGNVKFLHSHQIYDGEYNFEKLCIRSPCHQAVFYRKKLYEEFGNFNINFTTASDYVLHVKTFSGGAKWKYINQTIAIFNDTGASFVGKRDKAFYNELFKICYDNLGAKISDLALSRLFYSTYLHFFLSHKLSEDFKYLSLIVKKVGFFSLIKNFFILFLKYKIRNEQD
jgi:glycosyltransferase involved in cell wall biosynthesis